MCLTGSDENYPFSNQIQRMSCTTKTNTAMYYYISRLSRIMDIQDGGNYARSTPESQHLIYLTIIGCKAKNRYIRDLKKDNVIILKIWEVRMKRIYCPFLQDGLEKGGTSLLKGS